MKNNKIIDCVTFFDNNFIFEIRYNILVNYVDYFVICESKYDHAGKQKKQNFLFKEEYDTKKIRYIWLDKPFPKNTDRWQNQAIQRDYILENLDFASEEDFIFFSILYFIISSAENSLPENSLCAKVFNFKDISLGDIKILKCHPAL